MLNPDALFYTYPKFLLNNKIISPVRNREGKMSLAIIDVTNNNTQYIFPFVWNVIGFPSIEKNAIYFTASSGKSDQLFRWENDSLHAISETGGNLYRTGDYQLNVLQDKYVWTRFTSTGYQLVFANQHNITATKVPSDQWDQQSDFGVQSISDSLNQFLSEVSARDYRITGYSKSFRPFNFHSRRPYISDPDYSFSFVGENILNTLQSEIYINYNRNEEFKQIGFSAVYGGWIPFLKLGTQYTFDRNARIRNNGPRVYWNEWETSAGISVPLNFSKGRTRTYLTVGSDYVYNKRYIEGFFKDSLDNRAFGYINNSVVFSNQIQKARQHINPRFAQTGLLNYKRAINNLEGSQFLASGNLYFPGIFTNHSLVLQGAWHRRDTLNNIRFSNSFPFSRGYATDNFHRMWKLGANYHLPLVYPDWGFGNMVYFTYQGKSFL